MLSGANAFEISDIERMNIGAQQPAASGRNNVICPVVAQNNNSPATGFVLLYQVPMRTTACVEIFRPCCGWICPTSFIHERVYSMSDATVNRRVGRARRAEEGGIRGRFRTQNAARKCAILLRRLLSHDGKLQTKYIRFNIGGASRNLRSQADCVCRFVGSQSANTSAFPITNPL